MAYLGRKQTKCVLSHFPPLRIGHERVKIPGPKGLAALRPVLNAEPLDLGSKGRT